mgnify:CR=1 FL=1
MLQHCFQNVVIDNKLCSEITVSSKNKIKQINSYQFEHQFQEFQKM